MPLQAGRVSWAGPGCLEGCQERAGGLLCSRISPFRSPVLAPDRLDLAVRACSSLGLIPLLFLAASPERPIQAPSPGARSTRSGSQGLSLSWVVLGVHLLEEPDMSPFSCPVLAPDRLDLAVRACSSLGLISGRRSCKAQS